MSFNSMQIPTSNTCYSKIISIILVQLQRSLQNEIGRYRRSVNENVQWFGET